MVISEIKAAADLIKDLVAGSLMKRMLPHSLVLSLCLLLSLSATTSAYSSAHDTQFGEALPAGFIALSESEMTWADAVAYCRQQGGRLPRVNNNDSWAWTDAADIHIDGFGVPGASWPSGLPFGSYWTGTVDAGGSDHSWVVADYGGYITLPRSIQSLTLRVICLPSVKSITEEALKAAEEARLEEEARKAAEEARRVEEALKAAEEARLEEEARKAAEEARRVEEALKAAGFIALSESLMTWTDAVAYCRQQGGRLPRINNSDSWDGANPPMANVSIDVFRTAGVPWAEFGLPSDIYWTGTADAVRQGRSWIVYDNGGRVNGVSFPHGFTSRVVCVP